MKLAISNLGCIKESALQVNLMRHMENCNIERGTSIEESDYLLYVTCAGVGDTIDLIVKELSYLYYKAQELNIKVIVVGCLVVEHGYVFENFKDNPNFIFINNKDWVIPVVNLLTNMNKRTTNREKMLNRTNGLDKHNIAIQFMVQEGCTNKCSFCKFHYTDRPLNSVPIESIVQHLTYMVKIKGSKIIHLCGDNPTLYGIDLYGKQRLHELIHELSKIDGLEMINVQELVPGNMYEELLKEIVNNPKVVSTAFQIETASNRLLKLMNRNYTIEQYDYYAKKILDAGKYVKTLLMSGFPTETIEDMDFTIKYLRDRGIIIEDICEYTDIDLIPSSRLPQFSKREKALHSRYIHDGIVRINYDIYMSAMKRQTKLIYRGISDGVHKFYREIPDIPVISYSNRFNGVEIGSIITEPPKRLVKRNKVTKEMTYIL